MCRLLFALGHFKRCRYRAGIGSDYRYQTEPHCDLFRNRLTFYNVSG